MECELPKLDRGAAAELDAGITLEEINTAIAQFTNSKAPGPDGYVIEFYKKYCANLAPLMLRMFKRSKENAKLPQTLYEDTIALILKKYDRDSMEMSSYRPMSLPSIGNKVLTKILANRLKKYVSDIIHPDQTGFYPGLTYIYHNLRLLFNVMYHKVEAVVIALDAEKAFDQIEWKYMMSVLEHFGFGKEFINWIIIIYAHAMASVVTNQSMSQSFHLFKGCRQGCPISPALFAIAMESLAPRIRACADIASVKIRHSPQNFPTGR